MKMITALSDRRYLFLIASIAGIFSFTNTVDQTIDTVYYNAKWEKTGRENKHFYRVINREGPNEPIHVQDYYQNGGKQMDGWYSSLEPQIRDGEFTWWHFLKSSPRINLIKNSTVY